MVMATEVKKCDSAHSILQRMVQGFPATSPALHITVGDMEAEIVLHQQLGTVL